MLENTLSTCVLDAGGTIRCAYRSEISGSKADIVPQFEDPRMALDTASVDVTPEGTPRFFTNDLKIRYSDHSWAPSNSKCSASRGVAR